MIGFAFSSTDWWLSLSVLGTNRWIQYLLSADWLHFPGSPLVFDWFCLHDDAFPGSCSFQGDFLHPVKNPKWGTSRHPRSHYQWKAALSACPAESKQTKAAFSPQRDAGRTFYHLIKVKLYNTLDINFWLRIFPLLIGVVIYSNEEESSQATFRAARAG